MINLPSTPSQGARQASRELLSHIIHQRVDEIFQLVQREFERAGYGGGRLPAGGVGAGGAGPPPGVGGTARGGLRPPRPGGGPQGGDSRRGGSGPAARHRGAG